MKRDERVTVSETEYAERWRKRAARSRQRILQATRSAPRMTQRVARSYAESQLTDARNYRLISPGGGGSGSQGRCLEFFSPSESRRKVDTSRLGTPYCVPKHQSCGSPRRRENLGPFIRSSEEGGTTLVPSSSESGECAIAIARVAPRFSRTPFLSLRVSSLLEF